MYTAQEPACTVSQEEAFHPEIQPQFRELYWGMDMQEKEDVFQFLVEDFFTFYRQLFSFQDQVEILAPENIREEYQAQLKLILRKYIG